MGRDRALREQDRLRRVDAAGDQRRRHFADVGAQLRRVDVDGQRVEVGEEEQALGLVLHPHPAQDRAEQIAEVQVAGRLDAGNDAHRRSLAHSTSTFLRGGAVAIVFLVHAADEPGDREIDDPADADQRAEADRRARPTRAEEHVAERRCGRAQMAAAIASGGDQLLDDAADEPARDPEMAASRSRMT